MGGLYSLAAWDRGMFSAINQGMSNSFLDNLLPLFSDFSVWLVPLLILWVFFFMRTNRSGRLVAIGCFVVVVATDQITDNLLKPMFERDRPCNVIPAVHYYNDRGNWITTDKFALTTYKTSPGFPSNHAANIAGQAMYWSYFYPHLTPVMVLVAAAVGFSRIYLGHHYPGDVMVGYVVGIVLALVVAWVLKQWIMPKEET